MKTQRLNLRLCSGSRSLQSDANSASFHGLDSGCELLENDDNLPIASPSFVPGTLTGKNYWVCPEVPFAIAATLNLPLFTKGLRHRSGQPPHSAFYLSVSCSSFLSACSVNTQITRMAHAQLRIVQNLPGWGGQETPRCNFPQRNEANHTRHWD